jgi:hypothetical protein
MRVRSAVLVLALLAGCRPPASERYVERFALDDASRGPTVLMAAPDVAGAIWAESGGPDRIVFGQPGKAPLLALACAGDGADRVLSVTRFARTDPRAQGMMALVGNGHIERLKIDAANTAHGWIWRGNYRPEDTRLDALTGVRKLELTIPGAGTLVLEGSNRPAELIERCRRYVAPEAIRQPSAEPATDAPAEQD